MCLILTISPRRIGEIEEKSPLPFCDIRNNY